MEAVDDKDSSNEGAHIPLFHIRPLWALTSTQTRTVFSPLYSPIVHLISVLAAVISSSLTLCL